MSAWRWTRRPESLDQSLTSLTFTDVIFGLVFTEIFTRASALGALSTAVDVHLALSLAVVVGSYIGYRGSLKRATYKLYFFNLPLLRFTLDLFMIFLYYVLAVTPNETENPSALVHAQNDSLVLFLIFTAYLAWDLVSKVMSKRGYKVSFQWNRTAVTIGGFLAAGVVFGLAWTASSPLNQHLAIVVDSVLIAIAVLYRWAKDSIVQRPESPPDLTAGMDAVRDAVTELDKTIAAKPALKDGIDAVRDAVTELDKTIAAMPTD